MRKLALVALLLTLPACGERQKAADTANYHRSIKLHGEANG